MVPFAEVVLLTAMEYHREDEDKKEEIESNRETSKGQKDEQDGRDDPDGPVPPEVCNAWKPPSKERKNIHLDLKTIGISTFATFATFALISVFES